MFFSLHVKHCHFFVWFSWEELLTYGFVMACGVEIRFGPQKPPPLLVILYAKSGVVAVALYELYDTILKTRIWERFSRSLDLV